MSIISRARSTLDLFSVLLLATVKNILFVPSSCLSKVWRDCVCLGTYCFGISIRTGTSVGIFEMTLISLRYYLKESAVLLISSKEPPLRATSNIGSSDDA